MTHKSIPSPIYSIDAAGNRTKLLKDATAETIFLYDDNYRLTKSTESGLDTLWQWDAAGNLTRRATAGGDTWEYLWDARDKMTKVRKQPFGGAMADVAAYSYDAMGRRFQKTSGGQTTTYYQDGLTPVVEVKAGLTKRHRAFEGDLGNVVQTVDGANNTFYAYDARLGNVVATFGTDGRLKQNYNAYGMDAFGNIYAGNPENFGLTTKQLDLDTGLYYFNARWYEGNIGMFLSSTDYTPAVEGAYEFCEQNPVDFFDADGEMAVGSVIASGFVAGVGLPFVWLCVQFVDHADCHSDCTIYPVGSRGRTKCDNWCNANLTTDPSENPYTPPPN